MRGRWRTVKGARKMSIEEQVGNTRNYKLLCRIFFWIYVKKKNLTEVLFSTLTTVLKFYLTLPKEICEVERKFSKPSIVKYNFWWCCGEEYWCQSYSEWSGWHRKGTACLDAKTWSREGSLEEGEAWELLWTEYLSPCPPSPHPRLPPGLPRWWQW